MSLSRDVPHLDRAINEVHEMIKKYDRDFTGEELLRDNKERLRDPGLLYAILELLEEEGDIRLTRYDLQRMICQ